MVISTIRLLLSDVWVGIYFFFSIDLKTYFYHSHKLYYPQLNANERSLLNDLLVSQHTEICPTCPSPTGWSLILNQAFPLTIKGRM